MWWMCGRPDASQELICVSNALRSPAYAALENKRNFCKGASSPAHGPGSV